MAAAAGDDQGELFGGTAPRPLADRLRPHALTEVFGQSHLLGPEGPIGRMAASGRLGSMVLWGPPGCGKTTIARLLADVADLYFEPLSAVFSGVADLRRVFEAARNRRREGRGTLLFVDEIHRFNRAQQDGFLPYVESGTVTLIGATTENPSFELNAALLSRVQVFVLRRLDDPALERLLARAEALTGRVLPLDDGGRGALRAMADGDGRYLLTLCEEILALPFIGLPPVSLAAARPGRAAQGTPVLSTPERGTPERGTPERGTPERGAEATEGPEGTAAAPQAPSAPPEDERPLLDAAGVAAVLSRRLPMYDKAQDSHYNLISALHKSLRASDTDAGLYWLARMLAGGEDPHYILRRLARFAVEDIGLADPQAIVQALAAWDVYDRLGSPEGDLALAQCVIYLGTAPKSNAAYVAFKAASRAAAEFGSLAPPMNILNAPTGLMKDLGYGAGYVYDHDDPEGFSGQGCFPPEMGRRQFYRPAERGFEREIGRRVEYWERLRRRKGGE